MFSFHKGDKIRVRDEARKYPGVPGIVTREPRVYRWQEQEHVTVLLEGMHTERQVKSGDLVVILTAAELEILRGRRKVLAC